FLDSFWKLSRKNNIPDRWLLRDQDLDQLTEAMAIEKTDVRLRSLKRLERFMECYPPYWYYLARTQQQLGDADAAAETFRRLTEIGRGHFRQDDMLASSMANLSLIQESRRDPEAPETAQLAFEYSTRNWEANLVCAWILGRHRRYTAAEELILCNVDEQLETEQSSVALASLYYHSGDRQQLSKLLDEREMVQRIPIPALLLCAKLLGSENLPAAASEQLASTLTAVPRIVGRTSSISVAAAPGWKLADAEASISDGARRFEYSGHRDLEDRVEVSFSPSLNSPATGDPGNSLKLVLHYPQTPEVTVLLREDSRPAERSAPRNRNSGLLPAFVPTLQRQSGGSDRDVRVYRISEIDVAGTRLSLQPGAAATEQIRAEQAEISGLDDDTRPRLREIR
ncbi:MAG: tetratricopeptide repeat protein, partial [Planctomyces sp.]